MRFSFIDQEEEIGNGKDIIRSRRTIRWCRQKVVSKQAKVVYNTCSNDVIPIFIVGCENFSFLKSWYNSELAYWLIRSFYIYDDIFVNHFPLMSNYHYGDYYQDIIRKLISWHNTVIVKSGRLTNLYNIYNIIFHHIHTRLVLIRSNQYSYENIS